MERIKRESNVRQFYVPVIVKKAAKQLLCACLGFIMSKISFSGGLSPIGAAFAGGSSKEYLLSSSIGAALGALVFCNSLESLKYVGAVTVVFLLRVCFDKIIKAGKRIYIYPVVTFLSVLLCSGVVTIAVSLNAAEVVLTVCEAVISGAVSCFVYRVFVMLPSEKSAASASPGDMASYLLTFALILLALSFFPIMGFSAANVIAGFAVMLLSFSGKQSSGTITGVCCGTVLSLSAAQPHLLLALSLSGLLGGICCGYGKTAVAVSFVVCNSLALVLQGNEETAVMALAESISAALIFELIPVKILDRAVSVLRPFSRDYFADEAKKVLEMRIKKSAKAVRDIAFSVESVCRLLRRADKPDISAIPSDVKDDVCAGCLKKSFCWNENKALTQKAFSKSNRTLNTLGRLSPEDLDERLQIVCRAKSSICDSFNRCFCEYNARLSSRSEVYEMKAVAASQFLCAASILEDAVKGLDNSGESDTHMAAVISEAFDSEGFEYSSLLVQENNGHSTVEIFCTALPKLADYSSLLQRLTEKTNIEYMPPVADEYKDEGTVLCFCEKTGLNIEFFRSTHTSDGEKLSGDSCESFYDGKGVYYCILSDGMGTGARAALDSVMTSSLMSRLMRAGFGMETAFSAVNAALMVKSADETLATLDIMQIDLYTGKTVFYKAGSSFSVVRKGKRTAIVEKASLPLGIIKETKFEKSETVLADGDIIIMLSDGASVLTPQNFDEILRQHNAVSAKELSEIIVEAAVNASPSGRSDDITAAVMMLSTA